ncbi:MAG: SRPBCC family protein [Spirochaetia bacterium]
MNDTFTATARITIRATADKVWDALTNPKLIKQYLFGTEAKSDWKVGSAITYTGVWEGKSYEDKGTILEVVPRKKLRSTYWSGFSGKPDVPENYQTVTYELSEAGAETTLIVTQENNPSSASADHSGENWGKVLGAMKALLEK